MWKFQPNCHISQVLPSHNIFSQSVSLTQYVVLSVRHLSACPFQLASESSRDVVARRRSDYCPSGIIFKKNFRSLRPLRCQNLACLMSIGLRVFQVFTFEFNASFRTNVKVADCQFSINKNQSITQRPMMSVIGGICVGAT